MKVDEEEESENKIEHKSVRWIIIFEVLFNVINRK